VRDLNTYLGAVTPSPNKFPPLVRGDGVADV
jgi:hypothetical protein